MFTCLRCGYCCKALWVVIVDDPSKPPTEDNLTMYEGDGQCKHLRGDKPGEHNCALHNESWYHETVCARHNIDEEDCIIGYYVLKGVNNETI
jgi:hypothetical protein